MRFSALQRAEIAEIERSHLSSIVHKRVSVLFNEPKLLKFRGEPVGWRAYVGFSALQRAEIAEMEGGIIINVVDRK